MTPTYAELTVWLVIGALAGSLAGMLVRRTRAGFGPLSNLGLGLVGALIGGMLFNLLGIDLGLGRFSVSLEDLVSALVGSLLFLALLRLVRGGRRED